MSSCQSQKVLFYNNNMTPRIYLGLICLTAAILTRTITTTEAIKCYVCQSNIDPKCADPFDNLTLPITDCSAYPRADLAIKTPLDLLEEKRFFPFLSSSPQIEPLQAIVCRKTRQKVNGQWRTVRGCGYLVGPNGEASLANPNHLNECKMNLGNYDIFVESCTCNTKDGCNSATGLAGQISLVASTRWALASVLLVRLAIKGLI